MSFSSRRRNYLLTPHRRDGLISWMKSMLMHSFVLDALETTAADTFSHFEQLIDEHRSLEHRKNLEGSSVNESTVSRLQRLVPSVGTFVTRLPLKKAFIIYNEKYALTQRRHICISFNELRHILNLAQIMALRDGDDGDDTDIDEAEGENPFIVGSPLSGELHFKMDDSLEGTPFSGPKMITFDGDQTLYSDGANFDSNPKLANYLYLLLRRGVYIAVVTAAGYEYQTEKYELRLSGLLAYFEEKGLDPDHCDHFFLFGGECNYLLGLGHDYKLYPIKENGGGGWLTSTQHLRDSPANWDETDVQALLDEAEVTIKSSLEELEIPGRVIRKKRAIGLIPNKNHEIRREALDETVLRAQELLEKRNSDIPYCAFNGGRDVWVDVGNKRVRVEILTSYLGISLKETLHIGDQFLSTGNDVAARRVCPCVWITAPDETTYVLKSILRLAGMPYEEVKDDNESNSGHATLNVITNATKKNAIDMKEITRRQAIMDVYTGEVVTCNVECPH